MYKKSLIKIETVDDDLFLFIADLLQRIQKKRPDHLRVVTMDETNLTMLFVSSLYLGANVSRILMEQQRFFWDEQTEGGVKVELLYYKDLS